MEAIRRTSPLTAVASPSTSSQETGTYAGDGWPRPQSKICCPLPVCSSVLAPQSNMPEKGMSPYPLTSGPSGFDLRCGASGDGIFWRVIHPCRCYPCLGRVNQDISWAFSTAWLGWAFFPQCRFVHKLLISYTN